MCDTLIKVEGVSKKFCRSLKKSLWYGMQDLGNELLGRRHGGNGELRPEEFWAVKDVSFELKRGEALGLIGRNGAGKTTLLRLLNGLIKPDAGRIEMRGKVGALIALGAGFNPILTGRENIYVNASVLGLSKGEIEDKIEEIVDFSEIGEFIDSPVQSYSSGMQVRLGFAVATALKPDILLLDEVLAVGDVAFRGKCFRRIGEILNDAAVIFVSHNEAQIHRICNTALMLDSGRVHFHGETAEVLQSYRGIRCTSTPETRVVKDSRVLEIELQEASEQVEWGGELKLRFRIKLAERMSAGFMLIHFASESEFRANSEVRFPKGEAVRLNMGDNFLEFTLGPVHLVHGSYQISFSVFDESGKKTVAQLFDVCRMEVFGPVGSGPTHLIPMTLNIQTDSGTAG